MSALNDKLKEQLENLKSNQERYPNGLPLPEQGPCRCAQYENHDGKCLGPDCYCH
jgi:hypothetical protein